MTDRPILFSAPMVRALLEGRKTQTRRLLRWQGQLQPEIDGRRFVWYAGDRENGWELAPYVEGDRLWVRERFVVQQEMRSVSMKGPHVTICVDYPAGEGRPFDEHRRFVPLMEEDLVPAMRRRDDNKGGPQLRPGIHMPRAFSRLTLTVTDVRVQRLQEISPADAIAEGIPPTANSLTIDCDTPNPVDGYRTLWDSLNAKRAPWASNPWVVAVTFDVAQRNIDQLEKAA